MRPVKKGTINSQCKFPIIYVGSMATSCYYNTCAIMHSSGKLSATFWRVCCNNNYNILINSYFCSRISPEQLHAMYEPKMEKKDDD